MNKSTMVTVPADDPIVARMVDAIRTGHVLTLTQLLADHPDLVNARIEDRDNTRTLLHVAADWPGHFPNGAACVEALLTAGADVNARFSGAHSETPLHWAASSDDVDVLDALLEGGADIEAPGAVIGGGTPLDDAVGFRQWQAARRLIERGAQTRLCHEAALGMMDRVKARFAFAPQPSPRDITHAFWYACHGGQREAAEYLLERGADVNWLPDWENKSPLDAARREGAEGVVAWLKKLGAESASEL